MKKRLIALIAGFILVGFTGMAQAATTIHVIGTTNGDPTAYTKNLSIPDTCADLTIQPYQTNTGTDDLVKIKGDGSAAAVVDIQATGVTIQGLIIESPDTGNSTYPLVSVGAANTKIYNNTFKVYQGTDSLSGDIAIQTSSTADVSGLEIGGTDKPNTFTTLNSANAVNQGYEAIYVQYENIGTGLVKIENNIIGGDLNRGINIERSKVTITGNKITSTLNKALTGGGMSSAARSGIAIDDSKANADSGTYLSNLTMQGNKIGTGTPGEHGFLYGIEMGSNGHMTNVTIGGTQISEGNEITGNDVGIYMNGAMKISEIITMGYNKIYDNQDTSTPPLVTNLSIFQASGNTLTCNADHCWWGVTSAITDTFNITAGGEDPTINISPFSEDASLVQFALPVATAQSVTTNINTSKTITLAGTDGDTATLTYKIASVPEHGNLYDGEGTSGHEIISSDIVSGYTVTDSAYKVTFVPTTDYTGADSFTFTVNDGILDSEAATVSIAIQGIPDNIYVNAAWTNETAFNDDATKPEGLTWGYDAFNTIQAAINKAAN